MYQKPPLAKLKTSGLELVVPCAGNISTLGGHCTNAFFLALEMPIDPELVAEVLRTQGWFLTVITPDGKKPPEGSTVRLSAVCPTCAEKVIPRELFETFRAITRPPPSKG